MTFLVQHLQHGGVLGLCHAALTHVYSNDNKLDMQCMPRHSNMYSAASSYRSGTNVPRFLMFLGLGWNKI